MKLCGKCKESKDDVEFGTRINRTRTTLQSYCKPCHSVYRKDHYQRNKQKYLNKARRWRQKYKESVYEFLSEYFKSHPCIDCGEIDPVVLEFDHRNPEQKWMEISNLFTRGFPLLEIIKEVQKCDVRCANCHRRKTAVDNNWWKFTSTD